MTAAGWITTVATSLTALFLFIQLWRDKPRITILINKATKSVVTESEISGQFGYVQKITFELDVTFNNTGGKPTTLWNVSLWVPNDAGGLEKMQPTTYIMSATFGPDQEHLTQDIRLESFDSLHTKLLFVRQFSPQVQPPSVLINDCEVVLTCNDSRQKRYQKKVRPVTIGVEQDS